MELRSCVHLHFIQAVKGGLVTKVLNVTRGRPTLSFKDVTDIYDCIMFDNNKKVKAERSCIGVVGERTVKTEPDASVCIANDGDDQRICNLDDDGFDNFTLKQIKEKCKTRKRKHSCGLDSSKRKIKIEALSSLEDYREKEMAADDSDFMETLSSWRSKVSKNMKAKKRKCIKDPISTFDQEIIPIVKSEDIQNGQEFPSSSWDSAALVEAKFEVPEADYLNHLKLSNVCDESSASRGSDDCFSMVAIEEAEITHEWNLENELNYEWEEHADLIPLRVELPSGSDIVVSNSELTSDQSPNFPAIEFESEKCIIHPNLHYISPKTVSLVEDHNSDTCNNQPDDEIPISLPNMVAHKGLDCMGLGYREDSTVLGDCRKDEFTSDDESQAETTSVSEHGFNPGGSPVCSLNDSHEYEEKQSSASVRDDEKRPVTDATDELTNWDEDKGSSKMHFPIRLLSTRKAISPSSQQRLCKSMESMKLHHNDILKCRGKLCFSEQTGKKNGSALGLNGIMRAGFTDNPKKIENNSKAFKRGSHPKDIPHPSRQASRLGRLGCNSVQSCSKSAIAFSKQQMQEAEWLATKLSKELKSMKDIMDDMLRSEFCLNTSLRYKVNEARMAVRNATRAEEAAKRRLSIMAKDCSRFCMIMKLADGGPPVPQVVVPKETKKIAFADEAGGRLCQIRFYEE